MISKTDLGASYRINLRRINCYSTSKNYMTKETHFMQPKITFRQLSIQLLLLQGLQHNPQMLCILLLRLRLHQDIIYEHHHKLIQIRMENSIHVFHKYVWCISHTKRHHKILIVTIYNPESSLRYIF